MVGVIRGAPPEDFRSGYGYGDGYGYGSGYGSGPGSGSGDGSGYGDGEKTYHRLATDLWAARLPQQARTRLATLRESGATIAYWKSDEDGRPCNGGRGDAVKAGDIHEVKGPLNLCSSRALHATYFPSKWKGERTWLVALIGEVRDDGGKLGALKREILGECVSPV